MVTATPRRLLLLLALVLTALAPPETHAKHCARLCRSEIAACRAQCTQGSPRARRGCRKLCRRRLLELCRTTPEPVCLAGAGVRHVVVNGRELAGNDLATLEQLERGANVRVPNGRYWYDPTAGLWGREGHHTAGQIPPGLPLGGPLSPGASAGHTGVFLNGREVPAVELAFVSRCATAPPGRYWISASGIGGIEGQPASFDLIALCQAAGVLGPGRGGDTWYGSVLGDGDVVGGIFGDTGVTCGPDGGCVYS